MLCWLVYEIMVGSQVLRRFAGSACGCSNPCGPCNG